MWVWCNHKALLRKRQECQEKRSWNDRPTNWSDRLGRGRKWTWSQAMQVVSKSWKRRGN
jgi:hypothetical protein